MKAIMNNKKGSAMLWTVLLTIVITILLGAIMTASYAYFNYTMYTVKRQQSYFTARSAMSALLEEFSDQEQQAVAAPGGGTTYEDKDPDILPDRNATVDISDFGLDPKMGTATATIERKDNDQVEISVTAKYADEEYTMKSTVIKQPLYFAGVAIKNLTLNGNLTLGENTDLYWNNPATFDLRTQTGYNVYVDGNLITKGDAVVKSGTKVAHHQFQKDVVFSKADSRYIRKIWSPSEYVISNKTLVAVDEDGSTEYTSSILNTLKNITNYTLRYCNNSNAYKDSYFGYPSVLDTNAMGDLLKFLGMDKIYSDLKNQTMSLTDQSNNALAIKYIKLLSLSSAIQNEMDRVKEDGNWLQKIASGIYDVLLRDFINNNGLRVFDVSYIEFNARNENNRSDDVIPVVYLFVDGGKTAPLTVRVKYGKDPARESKIGGFLNDLNNNVSGAVAGFFGIDNRMSYVITYLEENSTIELGCTVGGRNDNPEDLVFAYSIYGGEGTTVILNKGVIVLGEIICDNLIVKGDAKVIYTNSSGSQIAKQRVAEYWTVINYSD